MTPPIPSWMRNARVQGYTNIYEVLPHEKRVYGTESLFGDWAGHVLILAQDFAPIRLVHERMRMGEREPFRHAERMQTNIRLIQHTKVIRRSDESASCGVLYGSAFAGLCKLDREVRGPLPSRKLAMEYGASVLRYVIENMPNLRSVVGLGSVPNAMMTEVLSPSSDWKAAREACEPVTTRAGLKLVFAAHPVSSTKREVVERRWGLVARTLSELNAA